MTFTFPIFSQSEEMHQTSPRKASGIGVFDDENCSKFLYVASGSLCALPEDRTKMKESSYLTTFFGRLRAENAPQRS